MSDEEIVAKAKKLLGNYERLLGLIDIMDKEYYLITKKEQIIGVMDKNCIELGKHEAFSVLSMSRYFAFDINGNHHYLSREIRIGGDTSDKQ